MPACLQSHIHSTCIIIWWLVAVWLFSQLLALVSMASIPGLLVESRQQSSSGFFALTPQLYRMIVSTQPALALSSIVYRLNPTSSTSQQSRFVHTCTPPPPTHTHTRVHAYSQALYRTVYTLRTHNYTTLCTRYTQFYTHVC